jgi:hypothetical protein
MFGWFEKKPAGLYPESKWIVAIDAGLISVTDDRGGTCSIQLYDVHGVIVETNDSGPWGADVWWLMLGADEEVRCAFPQGATGEDAVLDYFSVLPAFQHDQMAQAMASTDDARFAVWRRD